MEQNQSEQNQYEQQYQQQIQNSQQQQNINESVHKDMVNGHAIKQLKHLSVGYDYNEQQYEIVYQNFHKFLLRYIDMQIQQQYSLCVYYVKNVTINCVFNIINKYNKRNVVELAIVNIYGLQENTVKQMFKEEFCKLKILKFQNEVILGQSLGDQIGYGCREKTWQDNCCFYYYLKVLLLLWGMFKFVCVSTIVSHLLENVPGFVLKFNLKPYQGYDINFKEIPNLYFDKDKLPVVQQLYFKLCCISLSKLSRTKWPMLKILCICNSVLKIEQDQDAVEEDGYIMSIGNLFCSPSLKEVTLKNCSVSEYDLSKIEKRGCPLLEKLDLQGCKVSGKLLFNNDTNIGWSKLRQLCYGSGGFGKKNIAAGFSNIAVYPLPNLQKLTISYIIFYLGLSPIHKNAFKNISKANWPQLTSLSFCNFSKMQMDANYISNRFESSQNANFLN